MTNKFLAAVMVAMCTSASAWAAPFTVSSDFTEVTDDATGLVWRRCAEGAVPNSTGDCIGGASTLTHEAALALAKTVASSTGKAWRLPNVRELASLMKLESAPAIDTLAFPSTPAIATWTSTPAATDSSKAWAVDFYIGFIFNDVRTTANRVRLVRSGS